MLRYEDSSLYLTRGLIALALAEMEVGLGIYDEAVEYVRRRSNDGDIAKEFQRLARVYELISVQ
jgi:hypothetical protein